MFNKKQRKIKYYRRQWWCQIEDFKKFAKVIEETISHDAMTDREKLDDIRYFIEELPCWISEVDIYDLASLRGLLEKYKEKR